MSNTNNSLASVVFATSAASDELAASTAPVQLATITASKMLIMLAVSVELGMLTASLYELTDRRTDGRTNALKTDRRAVTIRII